MNKYIFIKFVSEPKLDIMKTIVGLACTAQAIKDGHQVTVFFAGAGTRLLEPHLIKELDEEMGADNEIVSSYMNIIVAGARLSCSLASVQIVLGHTQGDGALAVADDKIEWSGPAGVIAMATSADIQLIY